MIDKQNVLEQTDLLSLAISLSNNLHRVASSGGGEWAGSCPFCGGRDRFRVQPNHKPWGRWLCRGCADGKWQNAIDLVIRRDHCDFVSACKTLNHGRLPYSKYSSEKRYYGAYSPPHIDWQASASMAIDICERLLWEESGQKALNYLRKRGLCDDTIRGFNLGFSPGGKFSGLWIPSGIVIPCKTKNNIWYIKVRLMPNRPCKCIHCKTEMDGPGTCSICGKVTKYKGVKGNRTSAIFNANELTGAEIALFCEGEFDAMIAWQELQKEMGVATLGSASNKLDLATWGKYLQYAQVILVAYHNDEAGEKGTKSLMDISSRVFRVPLHDSPHKDINEFFINGGDLWEWINPFLQKYAPLDQENVS